MKDATTRKIPAQEHLANIILFRRAPVVNALAKGVKHPVMVPHLFPAEFSERGGKSSQVIEACDHEILPVVGRCEVGFEAGVPGSFHSAGLVAAATGGMRACAEWFQAGVTVCHGQLQNLAGVGKEKEMEGNA